jgi:hypothetical protein
MGETMPPADPWLVTTPDGTLFRCYVDGSEWKFTHVGEGKTYVGPRYDRPIVHEDELRGLVTSWWAVEKMNRKRDEWRADTDVKIEETRRRIRDA